MDNIQIKKRKNISYANLVQYTKELGYNIAWNKSTSVKEPLLYASAKIGQFVLHADLCIKDEIYYGLLLSLPMGEYQVLPEEYEESEAIFEIGFHTNQKKILEKLPRIEALLKEFQL